MESQMLFLKGQGRQICFIYTYQTYWDSIFQMFPRWCGKGDVYIDKRLEQVKPDVNNNLGLSDLPNKNTGYPIKSEFQTHNKKYFSGSLSQILHAHSYLKIIHHLSETQV